MNEQKQIREGILKIVNMYNNKLDRFLVFQYMTCFNLIKSSDRNKLKVYSEIDNLVKSNKLKLVDNDIKCFSNVKLIGLK